MLGAGPCYCLPLDCSGQFTTNSHFTYLSLTLLHILGKVDIFFVFFGTFFLCPCSPPSCWQLCEQIANNLSAGTHCLTAPSILWGGRPCLSLIWLSLLTLPYPPPCHLFISLSDNPPFADGPPYGSAEVWLDKSQHALLPMWWMHKYFK